MEDALRVLVAAGSLAYIEAVRRVLVSSPRAVLAAQTTVGQEVVAEALRAQADLALLDVHLPGRNGLAIARDLRRRAPAVKIVLLLSDDGPIYRHAASELGARWAAKDRLVEDLPAILRAAEGSAWGWDVPEGGLSVNRANLNVTYTGQLGVRAEDSAARDWIQRLLEGAKPALVIFLIGVGLLALTAFLAWDIHTPVVRYSASDSRVVDELGLFAAPGTVLELDRNDVDTYVAAQLAHHRSDLLLCLGLGLVGLAAGSVLLACCEFREQCSRERSSSTR